MHNNMEIKIHDITILMGLALLVLKILSIPVLGYIAGWGLIVVLCMWPFILILAILSFFIIVMSLLIPIMIISAIIEVLWQK